MGRALVALERGESPSVTPPAGRLGPVTEAGFHLAAGLAALGRDDARATTELDAAQKGIFHSGRLALLYGRARLQQGRIADAEQAMRIAERLDPNDGDVAVLDAEVALAKGLEDKVASALSVGAPTPRRLAVLGRALVLTARYKEAASALDAALARRPGDAVAVTYRAIARSHLGEQAAAQRELEKAAGSLALTTPHYGMGLLAYERHDLLRAQKELGKSLDHNPESFRARALLGRVLRDLGKPKEALDELLRVAREAPALVPVHAALGRLYLDLGRDREARGEFRKVLDAPGKASADDKLGYAESLTHLGLVAEADAALSDAAAAGALAPRMARLKLELQSWKGPKEALTAAKALEAQRRGPAVHDGRLAIATADAWRRAGDLKRAGDDLRAALFADPVHANLGLGKIQLMQNDNPGAEQSFKAALAAWEHAAGGVDDQTEARVGLARIQVARKAPADALATLTPCLTDDPSAPEPHYWLARAHADKGDADQARAQADKAVELDDHYADAFLLVGELNRAGHKDKARTAYKRYLELLPNGDGAKVARAALKNLK
jgi:tetratricopeptide (TPR) repeat protein